MTADILLFNSEVVPVGKDQKQHVEMARDIAIKFNNNYGEIFTLPEPEIDTSVATVPGTDGRKMSKSYDNAVLIFEEHNVMKKKIMRFVTDSTPMEEPKDPDTCNLYALYKLFADKEQQADMSARYRAGGLGYGHVKKELVELIWEHFEPFREKREEYLKRPDTVYDILKAGAAKTNIVAEETMEKVRAATGIKYR